MLVGQLPPNFNHSTSTSCMRCHVKKLDLHLNGTNLQSFEFNCSIATIDSNTSLEMFFTGFPVHFWCPNLAHHTCTDPRKYSDFPVQIYPSNINYKKPGHTFCKKLEQNASFSRTIVGKTANSVHVYKPKLGYLYNIIPYSVL